MKFKTTLFVLFIALSTRVASATCMTCLETYGVKVTLKDGTTVSGYVPWNSNYYPTETWISDINNWISQNGPVRKEIHTDRDLTLYKHWEEIKSPVHKYFAVSESAVSLPWSKIAKIESASDLPLRVDVSSLSVFPIADIRELQNHIAYCFSAEGESGIMGYYVGVSSSVSPISLLRHLFESKNNVLSFNGEELSVSRYDFGKYSLNCVGKLSKYSKACAKFRSDWEKYQDEMDQANFCRKEYSVLFNSLRSTTDYRSISEIPTVKEKNAECRKLEDNARQKYGFQPIWKKEELRKLGVIIFGSGTD